MIGSRCLLAFAASLALPLAMLEVVPAWGVDPPPASETSASTGSFQPTGSLAAPRALHTATLLPDGRVLVVGGGTWDGALASSAELWNPATGSFGPAAPPIEPRVYHTATLLRDGRVLVVGGAPGPLASAEIRDPVTGLFTPTGSLTEARSGHTATLLRDGRVLVVGGSDGHGPLATAELWDPVGGTFSPTGALAEARSGHTATLLQDGRVLVAGGSGGTWAGGAPGPLATAEVWDPTSGTFNSTGPLVEARSGHSATLLPDGRVLIADGEGISSDLGVYTRLLASTELWDPVSGTFRTPTWTSSPATWLIEVRAFHTATLLPDGRVLIVGGDGSHGATASAELWDPITGRSGPTGWLADRRVYHTATLLPDGRVLVAGGLGADLEHEYLASAEIWAP
jgi:hypothetical protein